MGPSHLPSSMPTNTLRLAPPGSQCAALVPGPLGPLGHTGQSHPSPEKQQLGTQGRNQVCRRACASNEGRPRGSGSPEPPPGWRDELKPERVVTARLSHPSARLLKAGGPQFPHVCNAVKCTPCRSSDQSCRVSRPARKSCACVVSETLSRVVVVNLGEGRATPRLPIPLSNAVLSDSVEKLRLCGPVSVSLDPSHDPWRGAGLFPAGAGGAHSELGVWAGKPSEIRARRQRCKWEALG